MTCSRPSRKTGARKNEDGGSDAMPEIYDPAAKRLVYLNKQPSLGSITAHNSLDSEARHLAGRQLRHGCRGRGA